nr:hypothetical protein BaRGS_011714 [Batillaria attramentaria]
MKVSNKSASEFSLLLPNPVSGETVVFYAYLPQEKYLHHGDVIILTSVTINQGNAYNSSTGEFTAPYNGTYFFTATASSARYSNTTDYYANVYVMVDYFTVTAVWTKSVSWYEMATCTYPIHLAKGQRVWLQAVDDGDFAGPNTSFSGFLLHADD